jgi:hypothetical protein
MRAEQRRPIAIDGAIEKPRAELVDGALRRVLRLQDMRSGVQGDDLLRTGRDMRSHCGYHPALEVHELARADAIFDRATVSPNADASPFAISDEDDRRADMCSALHATSVVACAVPGHGEGEHSGMCVGELEADSKIAVERGVLFGHHGLWRTLPRAYRIGVHAKDSACWMQKEVLP